MVELLMILMVVYTIIKAYHRVITPLWMMLELSVWIVIGVGLFFLERIISTDAVLTIIVGILLVATWVLGRQVRALREDLSRLNEAQARSKTKEK